MFATTYFKYEIISVEMDNFSVWLLQEIESRGWNQAELHWYLAIVKADAQNAHLRASPVDNWL